MTRYLGIDPGISGALALIGDQDGIEVHDMPTIEIRGKRRPDLPALRDILIDIGPVDLVVVEQVQGVQGSGATSAFNFGHGAGAIEMALVVLERPTQYVTPQRWTKDMGVGSDKGAHRRAAQRLFPDRASLFQRVKDDGRADAALLAYWGWRYGS